MSSSHQVVMVLMPLKCYVFVSVRACHNVGVGLLLGVLKNDLCLFAKHNENCTIGFT